MNEQQHEIKVTVDGIEEEFYPCAVSFWKSEEVEDAGYDPDSGNSLTMSRTTSTEWEIDYADVDCEEIYEALEKLPEGTQVVVRMWFDDDNDTEQSTVVSSPLPKKEVEKFLCSALEDVAQGNGFDGE